MAKNKKEKESQKTAAIPPIDAKRTAGAPGGGVGVSGIINQRNTNSPPNQGIITANINGKRELQKLPLLMETAPGTSDRSLTLLGEGMGRLVVLGRDMRDVETLSYVLISFTPHKQVRSGRNCSYKKFDKPVFCLTSYRIHYQI